MKEDIENTNRRAYPRVAWNSAVKFRPRWGGMDWEVSKIHNISVGGCYFDSVYPYETGETMEIEIRSTFLKGTVKFLGNVKRCESSEKALEKKYGIAVQFIEIVEDEADVFTKTIQDLMKQAQKN